MTICPIIFLSKINMLLSFRVFSHSSPTWCAVVVTPSFLQDKRPTQSISTRSVRKKNKTQETFQPLNIFLHFLLLVLFSTYRRPPDILPSPFPSIARQHHLAQREYQALQHLLPILLLFFPSPCLDKSLDRTQACQHTFFSSYCSFSYLVSIAFSSSHSVVGMWCYDYTSLYNLLCCSKEWHCEVF